MTWTPLAFDAPLTAYDAQAATLYDAWREGDTDAVTLLRHTLPRFLRQDVPWLPRHVTDADIRHAPLALDDARLATARAYDFRDWESLASHVAAAGDQDSLVSRFEALVEAVVDGDVASLEHALAADPSLVHARSSRITPFDPPVHRATLLHYVAANGVEQHRQRTPSNALDVARALLDAGADPDALADLYGGQCTTLTLLVSSDHPARAGVQTALIDLLATRGARLSPHGAGPWRCPVQTALVFGFLDAANALARHGAPVDRLPLAAGLGRAAEVRELLSAAPPASRHEAMALAVQNGQVDALRVLLDAGEDPGRFNPEGFHAHATLLHQAVAAGQVAVVRLLVAYGAPLEQRDRHHDATPLRWAEYLGQAEAAEVLRTAEGGGTRTSGV